MQLVASISADCVTESVRWRDPDFDPAADEGGLLHGRDAPTSAGIARAPPAQWLDLEALGEDFELAAPGKVAHDVDADAAGGGGAFGAAIAALCAAHRGSCPLALRSLFVAYNNVAGCGLPRWVRRVLADAFPQRVRHAVLPALTVGRRGGGCAAASRRGEAVGVHTVSAGMRGQLGGCVGKSAWPACAPRRGAPRV